MEYKVLIASAGLGNRLKGMTKNINKALVSVAHFARFFLKADLSIFGYQLPLLASLLVGTLTAVLAILLVRLRN